MAITIKIISVVDSDAGRLATYEGYEDGSLKVEGALNFSRSATPQAISKTVYAAVSQKIQELSATLIDMGDLIGLELTEEDTASIFSQETEG